MVTHSEQQSWLWSNSIFKGQSLYFKELSPLQWAAELSRDTRRERKEWEGDKKKTKKNIFLKKCCYYSCQVLKYTPWRPVVCALVGTQLESTPFSACWTKWHLVSAAERLWGDTVTQVLNAKLPVAAKHANTECKWVCAWSNLWTHPQTTHTRSFDGVSKIDKRKKKKKGPY